MAGEKRPAPLVVAALEWLRREPYHFDFFQAMRLLECAHPERPRLGHSTRSAEDPVRLAQMPSMSFAPSSLAEFTTTRQGIDRLVVHFFGLLGPNGPLPLHLTDYTQDRIRHANDPTFARFLDIFHHRMLSLLYRATANGRPAPQLDRPQEDRFALYVGALIGLGLESHRDRDPFPDHAKLSYAGHLVRHARNSEGLLAMVEDFLGLPAEIEEFVGHWIELPPDGRLKLGHDGGLGVLGESFTIGSRIWDCQYKFRIVLGPLSLADFQRLLPGGESLPRLVALVRNYVGDEFAWDLRLTLRKEEVPKVQLGKSGRLGYTMWLHSRPLTDDPGDLAIAPERAKGRTSPQATAVTPVGESHHA